MSLRYATIFDVRAKGSYLLIVSLFMLAVVLLGCAKEQAPASKGPECMVYEKIPGDISKKLEVNYDNKIKLVGITSKKLSQNQLEISYYWQLLNDLGAYKDIFVHFADASNNIVFQNDHRFCPNRSYEDLKGKFIKETFLVRIPEQATGKEITVKIGCYNPEPPGARLKIESSGGVPLEDESTRATADRLSL